MKRPEPEHRVRYVVHQVMPAEPGIVAIYKMQFKDELETSTFERDVIGWAVYDCFIELYMGEEKVSQVDKERRVGALVLDIFGSFVPFDAPGVEGEFICYEKNGVPFGQRVHNHTRQDLIDLEDGVVPWTDNIVPKENQYHLTYPKPAAP